MKLRESTLPPDLQYVLDGGVEYGHISGGAHVACWLFADIKELDRLHLLPHPGTRGWETTAAMCTDVEAYGQFLISQIDDPALKAACLGSTTTSFLRALSDYAEYVCGQAFEDELWGGSMVHAHAHRLDRRGRLWKRTARAMRSDAYVKRAVRYHHTEEGFKLLMRQRAIIGDPLPPATDAGFRLLHLTLSEQRQRSNERSRAYLREHAPQIRKEARRARRQDRRAIIRAATIASAILGATTVSAFARGEPVLLPADDIVFEISLGGEIGRTGHSALDVVLKDNANVFLAKMCIYQNDLPALDQLASLALHVQSGGVADVLAAGNLFNASPSAFTHPMLIGKKPPPPPPVDANRMPLLGRPFFADFEVRRKMVCVHEEVMGDRYRRRLFTDVLGRGATAAWDMFEAMRATENQHVADAEREAAEHADAE